MRKHLFPALILSLALAASPAHAALRALIVEEFTDPDVQVAADNVQAQLVARGFTVVRQDFLPGDLRPYCCVWDLRPFTDLKLFEAVTYRDFLRLGHGLFILGENTSCCMARNQSLLPFINNTLGGGTVDIQFERLGTFQELATPGNSINNTPNRVRIVTYDGQGAGIWERTGTGEILTQDAGFSLTTLAWRENGLSNAKEGRLVAILDLNWLSQTFPFTDNRDFLENISHFLCPATASGLAVTITSLPPFQTQCPDPLTLAGLADGSTADCVQPTTFAPQLAAAAPPGPRALPDDLPRREALSSAQWQAGEPAPAAVAGEVAYTVEPDALAAGDIVAINVSINGGPFVPVTSTTPALPAPAPVAFVAAGLALNLGPNTIQVEALLDSGQRAETSVGATMVDTIAPVIDPATCAPATVTLDAACKASYNVLPSASDTCDPTVTITPAPPLPLGFTAPGTQVVVYDAKDDSLNAASCARPVTAKDLTPPTLTCAPAQTIECSATGGSPLADPAVQAWLSLTTAADNCSVNPVTHAAPALFASGCPPGQATSVTFSATDGSGNPASCTSALTVRDTRPPALTLPAPLALECSAAGGVPKSAAPVQAWLGTFQAVDVCSAAVTRQDSAPALFPSGCAPGKVTTVTFDGVDDCANKASGTRTVTVVDTTAPALSVPPALTLECNGPGGIPLTDPTIQRWLNAATTSDLCGTASIAHDAPALFPSGCGAGRSTTVTFTALDNCGNATVRTSTITVRDTTAPKLSVPLPIVLECNSPGGVPLSDPQIQAWLAQAVASDVCDGATVTHDAPLLFPSGCAPGQTTTVTFRAVDNCGNLTTLTSTVTVQDTTPPVVGSVPFDGLCLWPPNHNFYCIDDVAAGVQASDLCDPGVAIAVLSCRSSQPEDDTGDGRFAPDCVSINGGKGLCVRSERQGTDPAGRTYTIEIGASDGCQNTAVTRARIYVPHDQSPAEDCARPNAGKSIPAKK